jgi:hypothetical protein
MSHLPKESPIGPSQHADEPSTEEMGEEAQPTDETREEYYPGMKVAH